MGATGKTPQRISDFGELSGVVETLPIFSSSPPRLVKTLKMLMTQQIFDPTADEPYPLSSSPKEWVTISLTTPPPTLCSS